MILTIETSKFKTSYNIDNINFVNLFIGKDLKEIPQKGQTIKVTKNEIKKLIQYMYEKRNVFENEDNKYFYKKLLNELENIKTNMTIVELANFIFY